MILRAAPVEHHTARYCFALARSAIKAYLPFSAVATLARLALVLAELGFRRVDGREGVARRRPQ